MSTRRGPKKDDGLIAQRQEANEAKDVVKTKESHPKPKLYPRGK